MTHPLLLHSVSYAGLWGQAFLSPEDFVAVAASLGYQGVMLMAKRPHVSVLDYDAARRSALRRRIEQAKLSQVVIAGYNNFTGDLEHGDIPQREMQVHYITELARLTADLGGSVVRVFTSYESAAATYAAQWKLTVDALRECADRAAEFGVTLGVQNHHDIAAGWETMRDLLCAVGHPNCKALFDAWAPALHGADIHAAGRAMGASTVHTTIADYQMRPRYKYLPQIVNYVQEPPAVLAVPMGEGFIDYRGFLAALGSSGFEGTIAYEMCSPLRDGSDRKTLDVYARRFVEWCAT